jgi:hypothetical protein
MAHSQHIRNYISIYGTGKTARFVYDVRILGLFPYWEQYFIVAFLIAKFQLGKAETSRVAMLHAVQGIASYQYEIIVIRLFLEVKGVIRIFSILMFLTPSVPYIKFWQSELCF